MGKVKPVIMGDIETEEAVKKKTEVKRVQKKLRKTQSTQKTSESEKSEKSDISDPPKLRRSDLPAGKAGFSDKSGPHRGKKYLESRKLVDKKKIYSLQDALELVKKTSYSKFDGTVELHLNVTEKGLRGSISLPHGTGKKIRVKIADDNLLGSLEKGEAVDFDILVAHPSMMAKLAKVAKILGPRGLMPNPKTGTISEDPQKAAEQLAKSTNWRTEPDFPLIHTILGKVSSETIKLEENFLALTKAVGKDKIKSAFIKATMGPVVKVQV